MSAAPKALSDHLDDLERALQRAVGDAEGELNHAARYVMGWEDAERRAVQTGGKRIRPALCLFAAETLGGDIEAAMPGAVAVELVHNFSLVHDEVQDHDAERHHRPTAWARFGEGQAINIGDYLYTRGIAALTQAGGDSTRRLAALAILHDAIGRMIEGQWRDISFESRGTVTPSEYLAMAAGKTGALLGAPLEIGAVLAGAEPRAAASLGEWGRAVGLAFQVRDDYLGIWGDPANTGKSNTSDILRRKKSLPIVIAMQKAGARDAIARAYAGPVGRAEVESVLEALDIAGAREACAEYGSRHVAEAERLLASLELRPDQFEQFRAIGDYLIARDA